MLGAEDLYNLLEIVVVDAANRRLADRHAQKVAERARTQRERR